jgi:hypothetical protein
MFTRTQSATSVMFATSSFQKRATCSPTTEFTPRPNPISASFAKHSSPSEEIIMIIFFDIAGQGMRNISFQTFIGPTRANTVM